MATITKVQFRSGSWSGSASQPRRPISSCWKLLVVSCIGISRSAEAIDRGSGCRLAVQERSGGFGDDRRARHLAHRQDVGLFGGDLCGNITHVLVVEREIAAADVVD